MTDNYQRTLPAVLLPVLIAACGGTTVLEHKDRIEQAQDNLDTYQDTLTRPDPEPDPLEATTVRWPANQAWLHQPAGDFHYHSPLRDALNELLPAQPVTWRINADYNPVVKADPDARSFADHLDSMALQANVHWQYHAGTLVFSPTTTRRYEIPLYGAGWNDVFITGNNLNPGTAQASGSRNTLTAQTNLRREVEGVITAALQIDPCADDEDVADSDVQMNLSTRNQPPALAGIASLLEPPPVQECYAISGTANLVTIRARPQTLFRFEDTYNHFIASLNRKANLKIITLKVDVTDLSQQRLDLDIIRNNTEITGSFQNITSDFTATQGPPTGAGVGAILTLALDRPGAPWSGSSIILRHLQSLANTSIEDSREVLAYSNRLITLQDTATTTFIDEIRRDPETVGQTTTIRTSISSDKILTGQALNILPSLTQDRIAMYIVINESSITRLKTEGTAEALITLPDTVNSDAVFNVTLGDQEIALIASSIRAESAVREDKSGLLPLTFLDRLLSNANEGQTRVYQTLYVIEASFRE